MLTARTILLTTAACMFCLFIIRAPQAKEPPTPFTIAAKAAILINTKSGQIVCAKNPDMPIAPASLTKIMTLVVAYDEIDNGYASLDDQVLISEKAWRTGGSKMFVAVNSRVPMRLLLEGIAVVSGNDACVAVAEHLAGVEDVFVEKMNRKASEIGMKNTVFKNSHGLPKGQLTTARDMALLANYYVNKHPETLKMHSIKEMSYNSITQQNRNGLLWLDSGFDGLKTGWFSSAGYHIVATAHQQQDRFIAVVLGAQSARQRETTAQQLVKYGFRNFTTIAVLDPKTPLASLSVQMGQQDTVAIGAEHELKLTLPRHELDDLIIQNELPESIAAPIALGSTLGTARITLQNRELASVPLIAMENIEKAGVFKLIVHTAKTSFLRPPYWGALLLAVFFIAALIMKAASRKKKNKDAGYRRRRRGDDIL